MTLVTPSRADAKQILAAWEKEDEYYTNMKDSVASKLNMAARPYPYLESGDNKVSRMTLDTIVPFSSTEPVDILYLDGRSEAGLPHTRGSNGIALPVFLLWTPIGFEKTIRHELVHLSQKQFPERWWTWYEREWNFRKCTPDEFMSIPEKWRARRRINPDTLGSPYTIWINRYIPLSVFVNDLSPDLKNCKRGFWDIELAQWTWEPPPGWVISFGHSFNDEHPNEIAAHWIDGSSTSERQAYFRLKPV